MEGMLILGTKYPASQTIYADTGDRGNLVVSTDDGRTWIALAEGFGAADMEAPVISAAYETVVNFICYEDGKMYQTNPADPTTAFQDAGWDVESLSTQGDRIKPARAGSTAEPVYSLFNAPTTDINWTLKRRSGGSWSDAQTGLTRARALFVWPRNSNWVIFVEEDTAIRFSSNGGYTLQNKTGNWATLFGSVTDLVKVAPAWAE